MLHRIRWSRRAPNPGSLGRMNHSRPALSQPIIGTFLMRVLILPDTTAVRHPSRCTPLSIAALLGKLPLGTASSPSLSRDVVRRRMRRVVII